MIKINLLPHYIIERRRVTAWAIGMVALLILEALALGAYVWAPLPFSLKQRLGAAKTRAAEAREKAAYVEGLDGEIGRVQARFAAKESWVTWVERADEVPAAWVKYLKMINDTIPADVVIHGLPLPSGGALNLSGSTSDMMSAVRWYLNMLRSDIVQPGRNSVVFNPGTVTGGETGPTTDPMRMSVGMTIALKPEVYEVVNMTPAGPAQVTGGSRVGGAGRMGATPGLGAGGGPRGGGGGPRGGRGGMRGGRGGPRGGRGGMRGGRGGMMRGGGG
ncbi:MAG: hypothetical protein JSV79_08140 [Armatimonadota bacterium]|nr:MAG: hypothetical protein JSV79_08140 [Armatimonadota bacterium]